MAGYDEDLETLAKELGLESLVTQVEAIELAEKPKKEKQTKKSKKNKAVAIEAQEPKEQTKPKGPKKATPDKNEKVGEIEGIPVNAWGRPIEYVDGQARELKVAWDKDEVEKYRQENGRILLRISLDPLRKKGGDTLDVIAQKADGSQMLIVSTNNHSRGLKRAKTWAVLLKLAFDPSKDIERVEKLG